MEEKIVASLRRHRIRYRGINLEEERSRVIIKAEVTPRSDSAKIFEKEMRLLGLRKVTGVYGRWEFRF